MVEYLYRVECNGEKFYEGTDLDGAKDIVTILSVRNDDEVTLKRAELVWWPLPPDVFDKGTT